LCVLFTHVFICASWRNGHGLLNKPYKRLQRHPALNAFTAF
jgi:hypothetical protein